MENHILLSELEYQDRINQTGGNVDICIKTTITTTYSDGLVTTKVVWKHSANCSRLRAENLQQFEWTNDDWLLYENREMIDRVVDRIVGGVRARVRNQEDQHPNNQKENIDVFNRNSTPQPFIPVPQVVTEPIPDIPLPQNFGPSITAMVDNRMEELRSFTLNDLYKKLGLSDLEFENYLIGLKLLHGYRKCICGGHMNRRVKANSSLAYRCGRCKKEKGYSVGTFFEGSHLTFKEVFQLAYFWSHDMTSEKFVKFQMKREDGTELGSEAIVNWKQFFRDICVEHLARNPVKLGGPGTIVEIDETVITRRKYNRGRMISTQQWFFAGVQRGTNFCFFVPVDRRDAATLLPIIQENILPGTTIMSDLWRAYSGINRLPEGYRHLTVNHSTNFVDPDTGAYTNTIESYNQKFKARHKQEYGTARTLLTQYMFQFIWKQRYGGRETFYNLISQICSQ